MRYIIIAALTVCAGCAGTQTREALTLRSPAFTVDPAILPPRMAERHDWNLRHAIDLSIQRQEREDRLDQLMWLK